MILSQHLPADSAVIVGTSMGKWSDFSHTVLNRETPGRLRGDGATAVLVKRATGQQKRKAKVDNDAAVDQKAKFDKDAAVDQKAKNFLPVLLNQGDVWLNLLTGAQSTAGLLEVPQKKWTRSMQLG
jgi:hypothetical protein